MTLLRVIFVLIFCFSWSCGPRKTSYLHEITGKVIGVKDGDTIEILFAGKPLVLRLEHIDCPELKNGQPYAKAAKEFTSGICAGQIVKIINENKYDRYRRLVGIVINAYGQNVNKELVMAGLAWHFKRYSSDDSYAKLENYARFKKVGLWKEQKQVAPWDWRARKK